MNYVKQLNAFNKKQNLEPLSAGQVALWLSLMDVCNLTGWREEFKVPNSRLENYTGLSRSGVRKAREALKEKGYIDFEFNGNSATTYHIKKLYAETVGGVASAQQSNSQSNRQNEQVNEQDETESAETVGGQGNTSMSNRQSNRRSNSRSNRQGAQQGNRQSNSQSNSRSNTLYKLNKTKLNNNSSSSLSSSSLSSDEVGNEDKEKEEFVQVQKSDDDIAREKELKKLTDFYQANFEMLSPFIIESLDDWLIDLGADVILHALKEAKRREANFKYAEAIMRDYVRKGVKDLEDVEASEASFNRKTNRASTSSAENELTGYEYLDAIEEMGL